MTAPMTRPSTTSTLPAMLRRVRRVTADRSARLVVHCWLHVFDGRRPLGFPDRPSSDATAHGHRVPPADELDPAPTSGMEPEERDRP